MQTGFWSAVAPGLQVYFLLLSGVLAEMLGYSFCPGLLLVLILYQIAQKNMKCMHNGVCSSLLWKGLHLKHDYKA